MKRRLGFVLALVLSLMVALGIVLSVVGTSQQATNGPVYSLAQIESSLSTNPRAWVGRTVLVRALLQYEPCPWRIPNGNSGHEFFYRYECYLAPAWVADRMRSHKMFMMPTPFRLAADPPRAPTFFLHSLPLIGRLVPVPRLDDVDGPLDTTPHVYRLLLAPPRDCTRYTTGGLVPCPQARLLGRVS